MQNRLSKLFFFGVASLLVVGLAFAFWPEPIGVDLATASSEALLVTVEEDGKTRIREKYIVSAPLSGRLLRIEMDPGDSVEAGGTLLAVIQPRDPELLDARALAQAEARVAAAETALRGADPEVERARLRVNNAELELGRISEAAAGGGATASEVDSAETLYRHTAQGVRSAVYAKEIAAFELDQARAALLRSRPEDETAAEVEATSGWNITIRSPITGRVLRVFQESAAVVTAGTPLLELGAPSDLEVEIDVLSSDAVRIEPNDRVLLDYWGGDQPLEGRVRLVEPAGFTKISTLGVEEQRVNVIVDLVSPASERDALGDAFRVEARIVTEEVADTLCVPTSTLFRVGDRWAVFKSVDGTARLTWVKVGKRNDLLAQVLDGLAAGDTVVIHPSDRVSDGVRVRPR